MEGLEPAAEAACLKGYDVMQAYTGETLERAIEYFDEAIAIDPAFAMAHAGRALAWRQMANNFVAPLDSLPQAKASARRAVELDDRLVDAHNALGFVALDLSPWNLTGIGIRRNGNFVGRSNWIRTLRKGKSDMGCI